MIDYGDALQAFRNTFKTNKLIEGYSREFISIWCYGYLVAKGYTLSYDKLKDKIYHTDHIR